VRILVNIDSAALDKDPEAIASIARGLLEGVIIYDQILLRAGLVPPLWKSGVVFMREPWAGRVDEFANAALCMQRGWGDCEDLAAWLCAEFRNAGDTNAGIKIYWRYGPGGVADIYHAEVRDGTGAVWDPARLLGMSSRRDG
jgi:hypothetical protein